MPPKHKSIQQLSINTQIQICKVSTEMAREILEELWYQYAERLVNKVADVCELNEVQRKALRAGALRPNDFLLG